jgi:hypothetical protein
LSPRDLKLGVGIAIDCVLEPIRIELNSHVEFKEIERLADPTANSSGEKDVKIPDVLEVVAMLGQT